MQTFVTESHLSDVALIITQTAKALDDKRLGKQRVEAKQIIQGSFPHHPATKMWAGHHAFLAVYAMGICHEWIGRGYEDTLWQYFADYTISRKQQTPTPPWWFGEQYMVMTHRSKLLRKDEIHYTPLFGLVDPTDFSCPTNIAKDYVLPYIWPDAHEEGRYTLSKAELKRGDYTVPDWWYINSDGEVTFA